MENTKRAPLLFQNITKDRMTHFNISVAVKCHKDNSKLHFHISSIFQKKGYNHKNLEAGHSCLLFS